jgi:phosphoenolpyruvate synthase/pyruvate phosphate dikinase
MYNNKAKLNKKQKHTMAKLLALAYIENNFNQVKITNDFITASTDIVQYVFDVLKSHNIKYRTKLDTNKNQATIKLCSN